MDARCSGGVARVGDLYSFGFARSTPISKSSTPMHASATPTWKRPFVGP